MRSLLLAPLTVGPAWAETPGSVIRIGVFAC